MVGSTQNCVQCFKILAGAQLKPVFGGFDTRLNLVKFGLGLQRLEHNSLSFDK